MTQPPARDLLPTPPAEAALATARAYARGADAANTRRAKAAGQAAGG
jgi:hypothetical protein